MDSPNTFSTRISRRDTSVPTHSICSPMGFSFSDGTLSVVRFSRKAKVSIQIEGITTAFRKNAFWKKPRPLTNSTQRKTMAPLLSVTPATTTNEQIVSQILKHSPFRSFTPDLYNIYIIRNKDRQKWSATRTVSQIYAQLKKKAVRRKAARRSTPTTSRRILCMNRKV